VEGRWAEWSEPVPECNEERKVPHVPRLADSHDGRIMSSMSTAFRKNQSRRWWAHRRGGAGRRPATGAAPAAACRAFHGGNAPLQRAGERFARCVSGEKAAISG